MLVPKIFSPFAHVFAGFSTMEDCPRDFSSLATRGKNEKQMYRDHFVTELFGSSSCAYMQQIHSSTVEKAWDFGLVGNSCDGIWTNKKGLPLVVQVADCVPLLIYVNSTDPIIFAVHVGRRGLVDGILDNVLLVLDTQFVPKSDVFVAVGPSICQKCYEFGDECYDLFCSDYIVCHDGKNYVDVQSQVVDKLLEYGISRLNLDTSGLCTYEQDKLLYSYRREGSSGRRIYGVIGLV